LSKLRRRERKEEFLPQIGADSRRSRERTHLFVYSSDGATSATRSAYDRRRPRTGHCPDT